MNMTQQRFSDTLMLHKAHVYKLCGGVTSRHFITSCNCVPQHLCCILCIGCKSTQFRETSLHNNCDDCKGPRMKDSVYQDHWNLVKPLIHRLYYCFRMLVQCFYNKPPAIDLGKKYIERTLDRTGSSFYDRHVYCSKIGIYRCLFLCKMYSQLRHH